MAKMIATDKNPTHDEIAAHAYEIYLREGCQEGRDIEHWLQAEAELRARATGGAALAQASTATTRTTRTDKPIALAPNSVAPRQTPIAEVTRTTTARRTAKREPALAK